MNINAIKSKVDAVINQYGTEIKVYRYIYSEDEYGCKNLDENMTYIGTIKGGIILVVFMSCLCHISV